MTNVEITTGFMRRLLGLDQPPLDLAKEEFCLRVSFKPAWMQPKVHVVFELVSRNDSKMVAGRFETPPMSIDDSITLADVKSLFHVEIKT